MKEYKNWKVIDVTKAKDGKPLAVRLGNHKPYENKLLYFKWDGAVGMFNYYNGHTFKDENVSEENMDYMSISRLRNFIGQLEEVLEIAEDILDKEDYEEYYK